MPQPFRCLGRGQQRTLYSLGQGFEHVVTSLNSVWFNLRVGLTIGLETEGKDLGSAINNKNI